MFGKSAVIDALSRGEISISYEYDLNAESPTRLHEVAVVDPDIPGASATQVFDRQFFGDRLGLTLGPIVVSDTFRRLPGRVLFKGRAGHFDLEKSNGEIDIMPGECLAVHSIEYIRVGAKTAAYILPRLTLATVGLITVPTYIDPYWEGILQLYITNISPHPHRLKFGERIAICRFYGVEGAVEDPEIKSQFAQKSHHYGLNWRRILDSDADVQPRRKQHVPAAAYRERFRIKATQFLANWNNFLGLAAGAGLIAAIFAYAKFDSKAGQVDSVAAQVQELRTNVDRNSAAQKELDNNLPQSGSFDLELPANQQQLTEEITLERRPVSGANVWVTSIPTNAPVAATTKIYCGFGTGDCKLHVTVQRTTSSLTALDVEIRWIILGR